MIYEAVQHRTTWSRTLGTRLNRLTAVNKHMHPSFQAAHDWTFTVTLTAIPDVQYVSAKVQGIGGSAPLIGGKGPHAK